MAETHDPAAEVAAESAPAQKAPAVERISDSLQNGIKVVTGANGKPPRFLKSLLSGTILVRHPLHPLLSDIPIGTWVLAALFDIIWLIDSSANAWAARAAEGAIILGALAGLAAVATGLSDWSDSYGSERTVGFYHGLLNTSALILYIVSLVLRLQVSNGESVVGAILAFIGVVCVSIAGYLGGEMVFAKGTQVNHTAWEAGSDDFEAVASVADLEDKKLHRVLVAGVPVVLLKLGDKYHAISATCSHAGGPLDEGTLEGDVVTCPWHGSRFSMQTGAVKTGPASIAQPRYEVRVQDGKIELKRHGGH